MPFNPDKINIHELVIEEPEQQSEPPFSPEIDISEEDWNAMKDRLKRTPDKYIAEAAAMLKIIRPDEDFSADVGLGAKINSRCYDLKEERDWHALVNLAAEAKILGCSLPERFDSKTKELIKDHLEDLRRREMQGKRIMLTEFVEMAANMKISGLGDVSLDDNDMEEIKDKIKTSPWAKSMHSAACLKILRPEVGSFFTDKKFWEEAKGLMKGAKGSLAQIEMRSAATILSADEVKVTSKGLELIRGKKESKDINPPLPETKQF